MKAGLLVIVLCAFIIYLTVIQRLKRNHLHLQQQLQQERFNQQILDSHIQVQEATFTSIGEELHDNVAQLINTALMLVNMTERELNPVPATLTAASATLNRSVIELRSLTKSLNKDWLEQFEFHQNLLTEVTRINQLGELSVNLFGDYESLPLAPGQQFLLFRIIQEGLQNTVRHANASTLTVRMITTEDQMIVTVKDDGTGMNTPAINRGIGIPNMRQRARSLGGSVDWVSELPGT